jgi:hypothetical protein
MGVWSPEPDVVSGRDAFPGLRERVPIARLGLERRWGLLTNRMETGRRSVLARWRIRSKLEHEVATVRVAFGLKAHSGWAALVVLGQPGDDLVVVDRRRVELVEANAASWTKQPYHAAEGLEPDDAGDLVKRGVDAARRMAVREMRVAVKRARESTHEIAACAVLVGEAMPVWSVAEVLAVHFRMHKAEGVIFRDALVRATKACGLRLVAIPEKSLAEYAERTLEAPSNSVAKKIATLGAAVGSPWGKDQKEAALAAMVALREHGE